VSAVVGRAPKAHVTLAAVTLDAAGTLFAPAEPVGATYARAARRHGLRVGEAGVERRFREAFRAAPPLAFPDARASDLRARERAWWRALVGAALGPGATSRTLDAVFEELFAHYARGEAWRVFPDVAPALAALRDRGLALAVVSNFDARLPRLLADLGLATLVDGVFHSTAAGVAKPDPGIFADAVASLGVPPAAAVHVGDSPEEDVAGALVAGLAAVLVDRTRRRPAVAPEVPVVSSLRGLLAVLAPRLG
jgi:putative hydrolase of the HAD superfamily